VYLRSDPDRILLIETPMLSSLKVVTTSLVVLIRVDLILKKKGPYTPASRITLTDPVREIKNGLFIMGLINDGLFWKIAAPFPGQGELPWLGRIFVGILPPGEYSLNLQLGVPANESVLFDGFRLFVLEIDPEILQQDTEFTQSP